MKKLNTFLLAATILCGVGLLASADEPGVHDPAVKAREHRQQARIRQGVKSGELTKDEAKGLRKEQRAIHQEEHQFKSDGTLTAAERAKIHSDLNKASKDIHAEKHDAEKRVVPRSATPAN